MSYESLQLYYENEPEPPHTYKGPSVGDSLYDSIKLLTVPTSTVNEAISESDGTDVNETEADTTMSLPKHKPKIALGMGRLAYHGDLYQKHYQGPLTARMAYDLAISQRLTRSFQLDFGTMFGKLGANEWLPDRHENFQSEIRAGFVRLLYDFGHLIPDEYKIRPFVSGGLSVFEFLSKTDLRDRDGNLYHYWSDGSIKDRPESGPEAQHARDLVRDYHYESDIRELNRDMFGKYPERAWAMPLGIGAVMKVTDRLDLKFSYQYWFSTTDYIDGITSKGQGVRKGNRMNDNFAYTSVSLQYDLIATKKPRKIKVDTLSPQDWLAIDISDSDKDGILDFADECHGTPEGVKVDEKGCPIDDDMDGIPNYRDDELTSAPGALVDGRGVTLDDEYWHKWYSQYLNDTLPTDVMVEVIGSPMDARSKKKKKSQDTKAYTVELVRYTGSIPSDELAFLLSIGDITSTTLEDGTTIVYTSGSYEKLSMAVRRRDDFRALGNKSAGISTVDGNNITPVRDDELEKLLEAELTELVNVDVTDTTGDDRFVSSDIVYRVQLGAFRNRIPVSVFNTSAGVLELKTGENVYRYVTKGYRTIEQAAAVRADLVIQGYSDAFVTAYKDGKRIPLSQTKATVTKEYKEDLTETNMFSSVDKSLISFKVQLGPLRKKAQEELMDNRVKGLQDLEKQITPSGSLRYTAGRFSTLDQAEKFRKLLEEQGFGDAFVIATFKDEIVSIQEALELMK